MLNAAVISLCIALLLPPVSQTTSSQKPTSASVAHALSILHEANRENAQNVGATIPSGVIVLSNSGRRIDLRKELRGRTVLIKAVSGRCIPCETIYAFIRANAEAIWNAQHVHFMIIVTSSVVSPALKMPPNVKVFYTKRKLTNGFLGGKLIPTTFFFANDMLIKRDAGLSGEPGNALRYPTDTRRPPPTPPKTTIRRQPGRAAASDLVSVELQQPAALKRTKSTSGAGFDGEPSLAFAQGSRDGVRGLRMAPQVALRPTRGLIVLNINANQDP